MRSHRKAELSVQNFVHIVIGRVAPDRSVLVGIDGGAGSGKTTFAGTLAESVRETGISVSTVHTDNFFRPSFERADRQFPLAVVSDLDWRRLRDQVIVPLWSGRSVRFQLYDWPADRLKDWHTIEVGGVVIVDGITAIRAELSDYYDLRIWFSCPRDVRVSRMLRRGDTSAADIEHWMPSEDRYIASHAPEKAAHVVVDAAAQNTLTLRDVTGSLIGEAPEQPEERK
ncbi:MAG: uridine kinase family protein [Planctomycetota bacterium]